MDVPIMEFFAALGAGVLVSLWSKYLLPLLPKCACCKKPNAAEPSDDITSSASTAAVIAAVISAASITHF